MKKAILFCTAMVFASLSITSCEPARDGFRTPDGVYHKGPPPPPGSTQINNAAKKLFKKIPPPPKPPTD